MPADTCDDDIHAIDALIARQFASLDWAPDRPSDWRAFGADFAEGATLWPSARPARARSVADFIERMQGLAGTTLTSFRDQVLGTHIRVFGNVAVALAASEHTENKIESARVVEAILLVKDAGRWRIVAQAWDNAGAGRPVPSDLAP
jgi:ketosteroid isomerase-like protein